MALALKTRVSRSLFALTVMGLLLGGVKIQSVAHGADGNYRRPVDLLSSGNGEHLLVACSGSGTLMLVDTKTNLVRRELSLDASVDALERIEGDLVAAVSTKGNKTYLLRWNDSDLAVVAAIDNSFAPVNCLWDHETKNLYVACQWSRRIDVISLAAMVLPQPASEATAGQQNAISKTEPVKLTVSSTWSLDFAPRSLVSLGNGRGIVIGDSFGRSVEVRDATTGHLTVNHDFFGSSIRGLAIHDEKLVAVHSMLNEYARTDQNEIHWGVLMANDVRLVTVDNLLNERGEKIYFGGRVNPLGVPGNGAAEPTDLDIHQSSSQFAVSVGGTDQVALGSSANYTFKYVNVGRYPTAVEFSPDGEFVFVANQFDDTVSVIDVKGLAVAGTVNLGTMRPLTEVELGEQLFHSATLSHDRWLTCASCHVDGHTNNQVTDNLGDRDYGAPKRVPSLLGVADTAPFTWLGHEEKLAKQVESSIRKTMHSYRRLDPDEIVHLVKFMESLPPAVSVREARGLTNDPVVARGRAVFEKNQCAECHNPGTLTSHDVYDVGVVDEKSHRFFNPPSLRGVSQRGPELFHDNRANGIRGVVVDLKHQLKTELDPEDVEALIAYLETL